MSMQSEGGKARAKKMSAERRSEISSIAANARWAGVPKQSRTIPCSSRISPRCLKEVVLVVANEAQANRTILKLNWNILYDHERIHGYVCPHCVTAHARGEVDAFDQVALNAVAKDTIVNAVESVLNLEDEHIASLHRSWDKSDCSESGLVRILLIQVLEEHVRKNGEHADVDQVELLRKIL